MPEVPLGFMAARWRALPAVLLPLILGLLPRLQELALQGEGGAALDAVEIFAGAAAITEASKALGLTCIGYDKTYAAGPAQDITRPQGLRAALSLIMRLKANAVVWAAPECKSWIFVARAGTGRCLERPGGDARVARVLNANHIVVAVVSVLAVAWLRGAEAFVEQPSSSLLGHYEPFKSFAEACLRHTCHTSLGAFGARTPKPVLLWASSPAVHTLQRPSPAGLERLTHKSRGGSVCGKRGALSESQAYPVGFGAEVAKMWRRLLQTKAARTPPSWNSMT